MTFLLVLEPDNLVRAVHANYPLTLIHEAARILGAAVIGGAVTPALFWLTRHRPVAGAERWRHALQHLLMIVAMALGLIVASCFAAAWGFAHRWVPSLVDVQQQLVSNGLLLVFALTCLTAITHWVQEPSPPHRSPGRSLPVGPLDRVLVTSRGHREWIKIVDVQWIESQGNYVTLHVGPRTHWVRMTLSALESRLDRAAFIRIHRRTIVALNQITGIRAEGNGDAAIRLDDGRELRASRRYRKDLRTRWLKR